MQDLGRIDYLAINEDGEGNADEIVLDEDLQDKLNSNQTYNIRTTFAKQKQAQKMRSLKANLCQIFVMNPYIYAQYKYEQILTSCQNLFFLSGASLGYCVQYLNLRSGRSRVLVVDDYDCAAMAQVVQRLQYPQFGVSSRGAIVGAYDALLQAYGELRQQIRPIVQQVVAAQRGEEYRGEPAPFDARAVVRLQAAFLLRVVRPCVALFNVRRYTETLVYQTGASNAANARNALADCNLVPQCTGQFVDMLQNYYARGPDGELRSAALQAPPVLSTHPELLTGGGLQLEDYCYTGEADGAGRQPVDLGALVAYEQQALFERRMALFGLEDFAETGRILNIRQGADGRFEVLGRRAFRCYLQEGFLDEVEAAYGRGEAGEGDVSPMEVWWGSG